MLFLRGFKLLSILFFSQFSVSVNAWVPAENWGPYYLQCLPHYKVNNGYATFLDIYPDGPVYSGVFDKYDQYGLKQWSRKISIFRKQCAHDDSYSALFIQVDTLSGDPGGLFNFDLIFTDESGIKTTLGEGAICSNLAECSRTFNFGSKFLAAFPRDTRLSFSSPFALEHNGAIGRVYVEGAVRDGAASNGPRGVLGTPAQGSVVSGVNVISGYHCDSNNIQIYIDGVYLGKAGSGTTLLGTLQTCGKTDTGFALLYNFNNLPEGNHVISVYADGALLQETEFNSIRSAGIPWVTGVNKSIVVEDFPEKGRRARLEWIQSIQNFSVVAVE
ncbi:MAG: hypothetical protein ACOZB0_03475 [Pseudomonadota bacterium]